MPTPVKTVRGVCAKHESFEKCLARIEATGREGFSALNETLKTIHLDLRNGAVTIGNLQTRVALMEKLLYGVTGTALTGVLLAILGLLLRGGS